YIIFFYVSGYPLDLHSFPTRRSSDLTVPNYFGLAAMSGFLLLQPIVRFWVPWPVGTGLLTLVAIAAAWWLKETYWRFIDTTSARSEEHTSELQSQSNLVCRLLLEKKK